MFKTNRCALSQTVAWLCAVSLTETFPSKGPDPAGGPQQ